FCTRRGGNLPPVEAKILQNTPTSRDAGGWDIRPYNQFQCFNKKPYSYTFGLIRTSRSIFIFSRSCTIRA
ncbi:MAG: hypothetical protein FWE44_06415, partial [Defluviitaleaceae bacterium]|nr:hypothetical protein [Defluviitaleaceae bacterium]